MFIRRRITTLFVLLGLTLTLAVTGPAQSNGQEGGRQSGPDAATSPTGAPVLKRVVAVGASLTAGFGTWRPLSKLLEPAIRTGHEPIRRHDDIMFFQRPITTGKRQIDRCLKRDPTLVLAIDFLFWYGYGYNFTASNDAAPGRLAKLEKGLAQLDRLKMPVVVGDIPDMHGAHPWMLSSFQIPSKATLAKLNERIRAWAKTKPNVLLVPVAEYVARMKRGEWKVSVPADDRTITASLDMRNGLQWDRLHPTQLGYIFLADELLRAMRERYRLGAEAIVYDPIKIVRQMDLMMELVEPEPLALERQSGR